MTTQLYIMCLLSGLLGIAFHVFAIKIPSVKVRAKSANMPFSIGAYLKDDLTAIIASIITVAIFVVAIDEIVGYNPSLIRFIKFGFAFVGYTGSSLLILAFGKFGGKINDIVDAKTDIADGKKN